MKKIIIFFAIIIIILCFIAVKYYNYKVNYNSIVNLNSEYSQYFDKEIQGIELASLIGLLHDIARFEQYTKYKTFNDLESFDHGDYGVEILKKDK